MRGDDDARGSRSRRSFCAALSVVLFVLATPSAALAPGRRGGRPCCGARDRLAGPRADAQRRARRGPERAARSRPGARKRSRADGARARDGARADIHRRGRRARHERAKGAPIVATVGLSESETTASRGWACRTTAERERSRWRFAGDLVAPDGEEPVRAGLVDAAARRERRLGACSAC